MSGDEELAAVRPNRMSFVRFGLYAMAVLLYGLIPVALVIPFGPPPGHSVYLVAWALGIAIASIVMRRVMQRMMDGCHLTLTTQYLTLGKKSPTMIRIHDVVDTVPILSERKPFEKPTATVNPEQFTVVLLRLRDGSRLPLSARRNVQGFENFLVKLFGLVGPTIRTQGELSAGDIAVLGPSDGNRLHGLDE